MSTTAVTIAGATGLTGSHTLTSLLLSPSPLSITALVRRAIEAPATPVNALTKLNTRIVPDLFEVPKAEEKVGAQGGVYISCLGTTRAKAGGTAEQEKLDLFLNRDLAKRARDDGAETMILVSSSGASASSSFFYTKIKGQMEEAVKEMGFAHTVILRPGLLLGDRTESRPTEAVAQFLFKGFKKIGLPVDSIAIDGADVGACIAHLAVHPPQEKVVTLGDHEIIAYAKQYRESQQAASKA
ncbi:hypothetical protein IAT38_001599 [Cryptococcus sp. DSM 104549]